MKPLEIDIYSDVVCPWCFIGKRRLEEALMSFRPALQVVTNHRPYLLHPEAPTEGIDLRAALVQRYRQSPERVFEPVEAAGRQAGIPLDFSKVTRTYSTIAAHTLLRHSSRKGTQRQLLDALFAAYFLEGRNIAQREVLVELAVQHGFTVTEADDLLSDPGELARTRDEADRAVEKGVRSVPFFIMNGWQTVSGAQTPGMFRRKIAAAVELPAAAAR